MHYSYIRALGALRDAANREMDAAQVHEPPSQALLDAINAVHAERQKILLAEPDAGALLREPALASQADRIDPPPRERRRL